MKLTKAMKEDFKKRIDDTVMDGEGFGSGKSPILNSSKSKRPVSWYEMKSGKEDVNRIDIIPYVVSKNYYENLRNHSNKPTGVKVGNMDYKLEVPIHNLPEGRRVLCLNWALRKPCPVCEEITNMQERGDEEKKWKPLTAKWRCFYNVIDKEEPKKGVQIIEMSFYLFEKYLKEEAIKGKNGIVPFASLDEGRTIVIKGKKKSIGEGKSKTSFVECDDIELEKRKEEYDESVLEKVYPLDKMLIVPTPEEVSEIFYEGEVSMGKKGKKYEEEEEKPKKKVKRKK